MRDLGGYQAVIDSVIAKMALNDTEAGITYLIAPSTSKPHVHDQMTATGRATIVTIFFLLCGIISLISLLSRMQTEKTTRMRDFMRMMGMSDTSYYLSHFIFYATSSLLLSAVISLVARLELFANTYFALLFIQTYLMLLNVFAFAVLFKYFPPHRSSVFSSPPTAKIGGTLLYTLGFVLFLQFVTHTAPSPRMRLLSLVPQIASHMSFYIIKTLAVFLPHL